jgi:chemotaxis protein histidine kinase CheA
MSDLIEDQKIHFIVKDYRRMYNTYWLLKEAMHVYDSLLNKKDKEILSLKAKVEDLEKYVELKGNTGSMKSKLSELESRSSAILDKLQKSVEQIEKNMTNVEELRQLINV